MLRRPGKFPLAIGIAQCRAGQVPDRGRRRPVQLRLYPRNAALAGHADHIDASLAVGAELGEGAVGEGHSQDRGARGDSADLEFQHASDIFAAEIRPHFVELLSGKRSGQDLDEGRDFFFSSHIDVKLRIAGQLLAKLSQVADEFVGITVPGISQKVGGDVIVLCRAAGRSTIGRGGPWPAARLPRLRCG